MSITKKIVLTLLCILSIVLGTGYFLGLAYFQTHFKIGTTINGFHCSFKSIDEAETLLSREVESYAIAVNTRNNGVEKIAANDVLISRITNYGLSPKWKSSTCQQTVIILMRQKCLQKWQN